MKKTLKNNEVRIFNTIAKPALLLMLFVMLGACVPVITTIYLTAEVKGVVIDASSLNPVANAPIMHLYQNETVANTVTNELGEFELPAYSEIQGKLLMVGHSFSQYLLMTSIESGNYLHAYQATSLMYHKETVLNEVVFVDSKPEVIVPPPTINDKSTSQWMDTIKSSAFSHCDVQLGQQAIRQLNLARKVLTHGNLAFTSLAYHQVELTWSHYAYSCKRNDIHIYNTESYKQQVTEIAQMNNEILTHITVDTGPKMKN